MKLLIALAALAFSISGHAQDSLSGKRIYKTRDEAEKAISNDSYTSVTGFVIKKNDLIHLGEGTMPDKTFAYIFESPSIMTMNTYVDYTQRKLPNMYNNRDAKVHSLVVSGTKRAGFFILVRIKGQGIGGYYIHIENAIPANEIKVPEEFQVRKKEASQSTSSTALSRADELAKWKKLLEDGTITQAEYDAEKKKLLRQ